MKRTWCAAMLGLAVRVAGQAPVSMTFSPQTYGNDGPWQTVQLSVGTNNQTVNLIPGGWYATEVLGLEVCDDMPLGQCAASAAGLYIVNSSNPIVAPGTVDIGGRVDQWNAGQELNISGGLAAIILDQTAFTASDQQQYIIPSTALSRVQKSSQTLLNGSSIGPEVGFLSLGAPELEIPYSLKNNSEGANLQVNGSTIPGFLRNASMIPSNSFGLHVGSGPLRYPGSLIFGGYDLSRAVGDAGQYDLTGVAGGEPLVPMVNVTLDVENGNTPFNTTNVGSLYRPGDTTNTTTWMSLNPFVPYMMMPPGTCEAIAEFLPVTWNAQLGYYLWDQDDPQFSRIVNSPACLVISLSRFDQLDLNIRVPFSVLNLTLSPPLTPQSVPYFPCKASYSKDGKFYLGRAFLQAAYLAVNWDLSVFSIAQASGPDSGPPEIMDILPETSIIATSEAANFGKSWASHWTQLPLNPNGAPSLSLAAKVGVGAGAAVGAIGIVSIGVFLWRRSSKRDRQPKAKSMVTSNSSTSSKMSIKCHGKPFSIYETSAENTIPSYSELGAVVNQRYQVPGGGSPTELQARNALGQLREYSRNMNSPGFMSSLGQNRSMPPIEIQGREIGDLPRAFRSQTLHHSSQPDDLHHRQQSRPQEHAYRRDSTNSAYHLSQRGATTNSNRNGLSIIGCQDRPSIAKDQRGYWVIQSRPQ